jgi:cell division protein FtsI/penicillin-binding protein 2
VHDIPQLWSSLEPFQYDRLLRLENRRSGYTPATLAEVRQSGIFRGRRRSVAVVITVTVLVIAAAGAAAGYLLLRTVGSPRQTAARFAASPGLPVVVSIDMRYQLAAAQAVRSADTTKPVDMVVIQPSTGRVLAVVERPGGFDRALLGEFPPGSTFKVVTASALARTGMRPSSAVQCPSQVDIGGRIFHNDDNEQLGATNLQTAFAVSCNSTFAMLATQRLDGAALASMAAAFGFNATPTPWASPRFSGSSPPRASRLTSQRTRSAREPTWSTR